MAKKINLGTLYIDGVKILPPTKPWVSSTTSAYKHPTLGAGNILGSATFNVLEVIESDEDESYVITWVDVKEDGSLLISDRCLYRCSYDTVNGYKELHEGKTIILDNKIYVLRFITEEEHMNYIANDLRLPNLPIPNNLDLQSEFDGGKYDTETNLVWNWVGIGCLFKGLRRSSNTQIDDIFDKPSGTSANTLNTNIALRLTLTLVSDNSENVMPSKLEKNSSLTEISDKVNNLCLGLELYKHRLATNLALKNINILEHEYKLSNLIDKVSELEGATPSSLYLYSEGNEHINITGGFNAYWLYGAGNFSKTSNRIKMGTPNVGGYNGRIISEELIDLRKYNKLMFVIDEASSSYSYSICVFNEKSMSSTPIASVNELKNPGTYVLDVSNVWNGYVGVNLSSHTNVSIKSIYLYK